MNRSIMATDANPVNVASRSIKAYPLSGLKFGDDIAVNTCKGVKYGIFCGYIRPQKTLNEHFIAYSKQINGLALNNAMGGDFDVDSIQLDIKKGGSIQRAADQGQITLLIDPHKVITDQSDYEFPDVDVSGLLTSFYAHEVNVQATRNLKYEKLENILKELDAKNVELNPQFKDYDGYDGCIYTMFDDGDLYNTSDLKEMSCKYTSQDFNHDRIYEVDRQSSPDDVYAAIGLHKNTEELQASHESRLHVYFSCGADGYRTAEQLSEDFIFFVIFKRHSMVGRILLEDEAGVAKEISLGSWSDVVSVLMESKPYLEIRNCLEHKLDYEEYMEQQHLCEVSQQEDK